MAVLASSADDLAARPIPLVCRPGYRQGMPGTTAGRRFPPEPLTRRELGRLLRTYGRSPSGRRDRALVVLLWRTGLRVSEALDLYPKDIDREHGTVRVLRGKGGRRREVAIDALALEFLDGWLPIRRRLGITDRAPLFCTIDRRCRGRRLHDSQVRQSLRRHARKAGIDKRVHPHGLRHTLAFELLMEGVPLGVIRAQLGHTQLSTTLRYVDHLAPAQAIRVVHQRPAPSLFV
jgi:site-specific recombinase XerD